MALAFAIEDFVRVITPTSSEFRGRAGTDDLTGPGSTGVGGSLSSWDPSGVGLLLPFVWDVDGQGWDQGSWDLKELVRLFLLEDIQPQLGDTVVAFTRNSMVTRVNEYDTIDNVAINAPAFDSLVGPNGLRRYLLRISDAGSVLSYTAAHAINRRLGSISLWWKAAAGSSTLWECGNFKLTKTSTTLSFTVRGLNGTDYMASSVHGWAVDTWHHIACSWSRPDNRIRLWTDDVLRQTTATVGRYEELANNFYVGFPAGGASAPGGYLADFRLWPMEVNQNLVDMLWAIQA